MHVQLLELAKAQDDVVAVWQLVADKWTEDSIGHRTAGMTRLHSGVFLTSRSPLTQRQRWRAATLTSPTSVLKLLIFHSMTLGGSTTTTHDGIPATTVPRTLVDLAPHLSEPALAKAFREAIRLRLTTAGQAPPPSKPWRRSTPGSK